MKRLQARWCLTAMRVEGIARRWLDQHGDALGDLLQAFQAGWHVGGEVELNSAAALMHAQHHRIEVDQYRVGPVVFSVRIRERAKGIHSNQDKRLRAYLR